MEIYVSSAILKLLHKESKSFLDFEKTFDIISPFLVQAHWLPGKLRWSSSNKEICADRWRLPLFHPPIFVYLLGPLGKDVWLLKMLWLVILGFLCDAYTRSHFWSQVICRCCILWPHGTWGKISLIGTSKKKKKILAWDFYSVKTEVFPRNLQLDWKLMDDKGWV